MCRGDGTNGRYGARYGTVQETTRLVQNNRRKLNDQFLTAPDNPIPRPLPLEELICDKSKPYALHNACYPLDSNPGQPWSLTEIFGRSIKGSCLTTDINGDITESLCIQIPHERNVYATEGATEIKNKAGTSRCFLLPPSEPFEMALPRQNILSAPKLPQPSLYASRSFTGHGQERGGVQTLLTNPSLDLPIDIIYFESLPWFMKPYLHTLNAQVMKRPSSNTKLIKSIYYRPALDRRRGTQLELLISVPKNSTVVLTYDFDKAILRYTEYPPDANRGFDIAPAVVRLPSTSNGSSSPFGAEYLRTPSLLLPLPTPDFSMPYNVIILTSTVMALAFGNIFNLLVRRFVAADEVEGFDIAKIRGRFRGRFIAIRDKIFKREKKTQ